MSVTVEYNSDDSRISRMISGMRGWRKWKAYANEKRANEATTKLNRNHAWMGWKFRVRPTDTKEPR